MRITVVTESCFPAVDGTTTTVKAVVDRLVDTGHAVQLIAPGPGLTTYRGCPVARVRPIDKPGRQVREAIAAFRPDLVHVASPGTLGRKALKILAGLDVPALVVEQSPRPRVADHAAGIVVTSRWMLDRVAELGGSASLWTPGVDTAAFTPALRDAWLHERWSRARTLPRPLVVVGYVGSLRNRHDVRRLAELATVPGIRPVVVGDGPQRGWLEQRLPDAKFTGELGTGDLAAVLPTFDLLVHPGTRETCCHALREASAAGVPVVAPRSGGAPDAVHHLESGLLYDPSEQRGFRRAVEALAADGSRSLLGRRGRELSTRSWADAIDELVERHYHPLLAGRSALAGNALKEVPPVGAAVASVVSRSAGQGGGGSRGGATATDDNEVQCPRGGAQQA